jgi:hypothetical protein
VPNSHLRSTIETKQLPQNRCLTDCGESPKEMSAAAAIRTSHAMLCQARARADRAAGTRYARCVCSVGIAMTRTRYSYFGEVYFSSAQRQT